MTYQPSQQEYNYPQSRVYHYRRPSATTQFAPDPRVAASLEFLGYVGLLGLGHMYAGYEKRGIGILVGWLVVVGLLIQSFMAYQGPVLCLFVPALAGPIISFRWVASSIKNSDPPDRLINTRK